MSQKQPTKKLAQYLYFNSKRYLQLSEKEQIKDCISVRGTFKLKQSNCFQIPFLKNDGCYLASISYTQIFGNLLHNKIFDIPWEINKYWAKLKIVVPPEIEQVLKTCIQYLKKNKLINNAPRFLQPMIQNESKLIPFCDIKKNCLECSIDLDVFNPKWFNKYPKYQRKILKRIPPLIKNSSELYHLCLIPGWPGSYIQNIKIKKIKQEHFLSYNNYFFRQILALYLNDFSIQYFRRALYQMQFRAYTFLFLKYKKNLKEFKNLLIKKISKIKKSILF